MKQTIPVLAVGSWSNTFHVAQRQKYTYRLRRCFVCAPRPHSRGGIHAASGADSTALPDSTHPPRPFALSLYGGLPITTVIGSCRLISFACCRDFAIGPKIAGSQSCSSYGLPSAS